ncbi:N-acetyltransferase GCN5 [groundwater metagenome]
MRIRKATQEDFLSVHKFTAGCPPMENYPEHVYKIILRYFGDYCFVAEENEHIIGFAMGIVPQSFPGTFFLWQIGITPSRQGQGIGGKLVREIENELKKLEFKRIEVTIDPVNLPSQKLFEKMGYQNISDRVGKTIEVEGNIAVQDYYKPGRHFMVYEKWIGES